MHSRKANQKQFSQTVKEVLGVHKEPCLMGSANGMEKSFSVLLMHEVSCRFLYDTCVNEEVLSGLLLFV